MSKHQGSFKNSEVEKLSSELKFISKIQAGQRIDISTKTLQDNTYWTSTSRTFQRLTTFNRKNIESREKIYKYVIDVIQDSLSMLESLSNSSNEYDLEICKNLISDLVNVRYGLKNLQITYKDDQMYVSRLETLLQTDLDVKLRELCSKRTIDFDEIVQNVEDQHQANEEAEAAENSNNDESETSDNDEAEAETSNNDEAETNNDEAETSNNDEAKESEENLPVLPPSPRDSKKKETVRESPTHAEEMERPDPSPRSNRSYREIVQPSSGNRFEVLSQLDRIRVKVKDEILKGEDESPNSSRRKARKRRNKNPSYQYDPQYFMNNDDDDIILKNTDLEKGLIH